MSVDVKYRTTATATGGRDGSARTDDGSLEVKLAVPKEMGGPGGGGAVLDVDAHGNLLVEEID